MVCFIVLWGSTIDDVFRFSLGVLLGLAPSHHIVMENLLVGRDEGESKGKDLWQSGHDLPTSHDSQVPWKWETWDLKPTTYFLPERDIAQGRLTSQATTSRLADEFHEKLCLTQDQSDTFMSQPDKDSKVLAQSNAVDLADSRGRLFATAIAIPILSALEKRLDALSIPVSQACVKYLQELVCYVILINARPKDFAPEFLTPLHKVLNMEGGLDAFFAR